MPQIPAAFTSPSPRKLRQIADQQRALRPSGGLPATSRLYSNQLLLLGLNPISIWCKTTVSYFDSQPVLSTLDGAASRLDRQDDHLRKNYPYLTNISPHFFPCSCLVVLYLLTHCLCILTLSLLFESANVPSGEIKKQEYGFPVFLVWSYSVFQENLCQHTTHQTDVTVIICFCAKASS